MIRKYGSPPWRAAVLHGGPGAPGSMAVVARELARTAGTLEPIQSQDTVAGLIEELDEQLREFVQEPILLIGHSWGAWLALLYAAQHGERVRQVVLVGAGPLDSRYVGQIAKRRQSRLAPEQNTEFIDAVATLESTVDRTACDEAMQRLATLTRLTDNFLLKEPMAEEANDALPTNARQYAAIWPEAARFA